MPLNSFLSCGDRRKGFLTVQSIVMSTSTEGYLVRHTDDLDAHRSTCGFRRQLFTVDDSASLSCSVLDIDDAKAHYHQLVIEGESVPVRPGTSVLIRPGTRHQGRGGFRTLVLCSPAFTPDDQYYD
jgi:hypothetical protein